MGYRSSGLIALGIELESSDKIKDILITNPTLAIELLKGKDVNTYDIELQLKNVKILDKIEFDKVEKIIYNDDVLYVYHFNWWKYYETYIDVKVINNIIRQCKELGLYYHFIRVGEDEDDIDNQGVYNHIFYTETKIITDYD